MKQEMGLVSFLSKHPARNVLFSLVAVSLLWALVNYPVMITLWRHGFDDGTYSHAYLIPFIFIYLLYVLARRGELRVRETMYVPAIVGCLLVAVGYYFALAAQISLAYWVFSLASLATACWLFVKFSPGLVYSLAFLLFMYPLWGALQFVLQHFSVFAVMHIMMLTGIPTYVEGTSVMIPEGTFVIAGGCSGLRYFIVSLAIGSMFVFLNLRSKTSIAKFMALAIIGALITNWIRIVSLVLIGHFTDMQSELMRDHNNFGWYLYAPFIILLFWYGEKLVKAEPKGQFEEMEEQAQSATYALKLKSVGLAFMCIVLFSSALQLNLLTSPLIKDEDCDALEALGSAAPELSYGPDICVRDQRAGGTVFETVSARYSGNDLDGKPTQYQSRMVPEGWRELQSQQMAGWTVRVFSEGRERHFLAQSYIVPGIQVATEMEMKAIRLKNAIKGERRSGLLWAHAVCDADCDDLVKQWPAISQAFTFNRF